MMKFLLIIIAVLSVSYRSDNSITREHVTIVLYPYESDGKMKVSALPELKAESELNKYKRRFEYILMNVPEIHKPENADRRKKIWDLYPDTTELKRLYLNEYVQDKKLVGYFKEMAQHIQNPNMTKKLNFSQDELMEVASKFFYCDKVLPDTSVQAHVCIGLNGINEANWSKDFTFLEAFCFEGIFNDLDKDTSLIWDSFVSLKDESEIKHRSEISSLDDYLEKVKLDVFKQMKNNGILKTVLLEYYEMNKANVAFKIINEDQRKPLNDR